MTTSTSRYCLYLLLATCLFISSHADQDEHEHDHSHDGDDDVMDGLTVSPAGSMEAQSGDKVTITCSSHDDTHHTWLVDDKPLPETGTEISEVVEDHVRISTLNIVVKADMTVACSDEDNHADTVSISIVGEDHDHAHDHDHEHHGDDTHEDHDHLEMSPTDAINVAEGEAVTIQCTCHDGTTITWSHGDETLTSGSGLAIEDTSAGHELTSRLVIEEATADDAGTYTCYDNDDHKAAKSVTVNVEQGSSAVKACLQSMLLGIIACLVSLLA